MAKNKEKNTKIEKALTLSELLCKTMEEQGLSVMSLAKKANLSPTIIQAMRSETKKDFSFKSVVKILKGLGFTRLYAQRDDGTTITLLDITKTKDLD